MNPYRDLSEAVRGFARGMVDEHSLLANVLEHVPDIIYVKDLTGRYVLDNEAHRRLLGVATLADVAGKSSYDFVPKDLADRYAADDRMVVESGVSILDREEEIVDNHGRRRWMATTKTPLRDADGRIVGLIGRGRDITAQRLAEEALRRERELLHALLDNIPDTIYFKDTQSRFTRVNAAQARLLGIARPEDAVGKTDFDYFMPEHAQAAFADEQRIIATGQPLIGKPERIRRGTDGQLIWVSSTKVPIRDERGEVVGIVGISRDINDAKLAEEKVAAYAAQLRERNAQLEEDRKLAGEMQLALLPQTCPRFVRPGRDTAALEFTHRYLPSGFVGGDFFNIVRLSDSVAGVFICDVMGKGVKAALVTAMVRALVEELSREAADPAQFLAVISRDLQAALQALPSPVFVTAFYATLDAATGTLCYASAGHPPALHVQPATGAVTLLAAGNGEVGPVLGLFDGAAYKSATRILAPGDRLLLYTDGTYEAMNAAGEQYGEERLLRSVQRRHREPTAAVLDGLLDDIQQFMAGCEFGDDVCLLAVEVLPDRRPRNSGVAG
jgi:sigma-B regulation protein RsbU (phosphoserine phosphatase)